MFSFAFCPSSVMVLEDPVYPPRWIDPAFTVALSLIMSVPDPLSPTVSLPVTSQVDPAFSVTIPVDCSLTAMTP